MGGYRDRPGGGRVKPGEYQPPCHYGPRLNEAFAIACDNANRRWNEMYGDEEERRKRAEANRLQEFYHPAPGRSLFPLDT